MRRSLLFIIPLALVIVLSGLVLLYFRQHRPVPTLFKWKAQVSTLAGTGSPNFLDAQRAIQSEFSDPFGVAIGADGTIFVADAGESNRIRKITPEGAQTVLAGSTEGFADGVPSSFNTPSALAIDRDGNLYVADTGNHRIRKVTQEGVVSTVAGNGKAGFADGPAAAAEFNGPIGIALDAQNNIYVADTYNDRIRKISVDGQVTTTAGGDGPGSTEGDSASARFDTPCGVVVAPDGTLIVADTGNGKLRRVTTTGQVSTVQITFDDDLSRNGLRAPVGLALTHDGFLYVTEQDRGSVTQIAPDGKACTIGGNGSGFADGFGEDARFNHPSGLAVDPASGDLVVADSANYLVRKLSHGEKLAPTQGITDQLPRLTQESTGEKNLLWPLDPQDKPHEVVATMGEVRGSFDSTDSRDHLHSGLDVSGAYGDTVRVSRWEKVTSPIPNWGLDDLSEGIRIALISYIHIHVGRDKDGKVFEDARFIPVKDDAGKITRMRVRRGASFRPGDALGTVNRMYHVHLIIGPPGGQVNPLLFSPIGFKDTIAPTIEKDGIQLFEATGKRLEEMDHNRLLVKGRVKIIVDAFDRADMNSDRRRLGLYSLGYQVLQATPSDSALSPVAGFSSPLITILFNRLPSDDNATKLAYGVESGITVYGSKTTRFLYEITNTVRDGHARAGWWETSELPRGDYVLRVVGADYSGNKTQKDVAFRIR